MDFVLFIKIIAWVGVIIFGLGTALSVYLWYYYEFTVSGKLEQLSYQLKGQVITGYKFWARFLPFIICVALLISLY